MPTAAAINTVAGINAGKASFLKKARLLTTHERNPILIFFVHLSYND
jgi:hypothetical protein